jgi:TRAP-type C4-dicarboxylate transport system substrate-binding protein
VKFNRLLKAVVVAGSLATFALPFSANSAEVTLRFHQQLPPQAAIPKFAIMPWIQSVEKASKGRIKIQHFPAMQLGGKPPELFDQAKNGVVDLSWAVLGYNPGRFPKSEVFELPFMTAGAERGSRAFQEYVEKYAMDEFKDVKLIGVHVHGPGMFHTKDPVTSLGDIKGMKIRGASRVINIMLGQMGAVGVGMPVPAVGPALSKGVIQGAMLPYEIVPALKLHQLVKNHTVVQGDKGLFTLTFAVVMNKAKYDALPDDLKKVIDAHSGERAAALFGRAMDKGDAIGKSLIEKAGNKVHVLDAAAAAPFKRTAGTTRDVWIADAKKAGIDGADLIQKAESIISRY